MAADVARAFPVEPLDGGESLRILHIDDEQADTERLACQLRRHGVAAEFLRVAEPAALLDALANRHWDAILADALLARLDFHDCLRQCGESLPDTPFILISTAIGEESALELFQEGVWDFVRKDNLQRLHPVLLKNIHASAERRARRAAEQALHDSEQQFRVIFERSNDAILLSNEAGFIDCNARAVEMFGATSKAQLLGLHSWDLSPPVQPDGRESRSAAAQLIADAYSNGGARFDWMQQRLNGEQFPAEVVISLAMHRGEVLRIGAVRDTTERVRADAALRESEATYRSLFENMLNGFAYCKMIFEGDEPADFIYLNVNAAFGRLTGLKDVAGNKAGDVIPGLREKDQELLRRYGRVARTGHPERFEIFVEAMKMWFHISVYSPKPEHFVAVFDVITAQKQREAVLEERTAALKQAQQQAKIGNWNWNTTTGQRVWSEQLFHIYGIDPSEPPVPFLDMWRFFTPTGWQRLAAAIESCRTAGIAYDFDIESVRPNGQHRWLSMRAEMYEDEHLGHRIMRGTVQDITERKLANEEQHRLSEAMRQTSQPVMIADAEMRITFVNAAFERLMGYRLEELLGRPVSRFSSGPWAEQQLKDISAQLQHENAWRGELLGVTKDGTEIPVYSTVAGIRDLSNHLIGFVSSIIDLRPLKEKTLALQQSEERYHSVLDHAADAVFVIGQDLRCLYANRQAATLLGYSQTELLGLSLADVTPAPDHAHVAALIEQLVHEKHLTSELTLLRSDGSPVLVEVNAITLPDGTLFGSCRDITERRAAEEQIRKLSQTVEQSPNSIVITDLKANIEYVNDTFLGITGYSRDEVVGQNSRFLHSGNTPRENYSALWAALSQGRTWKGEFHNRRKDGSEYVEFAVITPIRQANGRISHYVAIKEDITEKKRMARELDSYRHHLEELVQQRTAELREAKAQAETATVAKSAFLANMSHEIRTPMNAIVGLAHLLRRGAVSPEQAERVNKINAAAAHLLSIINSILDLSKIEAGKVVLERESFQLGALLDQVVSIAADGARAKGLELEVKCAQPELWLSGDQTRLRQALLNYVNNAVKFTEQGRVIIRARVLEDSDPETLLRFEVKDTGIGIDPGKLPHLFSAFEQADTSTTRKYGGTGLGLAITMHMARLMGGEVGAESEPGQGSLFWFTARLERSATQAPAPVSGSYDQAQICRRCVGARVLLAEDDPINQEVACSLLADSGLRVDVASNGLEAVRMVAAQSYDLVLMDMQMPEMDGLDATRAIRALPGQGAVPILAMTANAFTEDRHRCIEAGMNDFIAKPVDPATMFNTICKWLPAAAAESAPPADSPSAQPTGDAGLRLRLEAIPGLDARHGLERVAGQAELYLHLLHSFSDSHRDDAARLRELCAAGDSAAALALAHSLKGVAANLALTPLQEAAAALEALERQGGGAPDALLATVETELQRLALALDALPEAAAAASTRNLPAALLELRQLLQSGDFRACRLFAELLPQLRATLEATRLVRLERSMDTLDFPAALALLVTEA